MRNEEQFFLNILSDHLHERKTVLPPQQLDWELLIGLLKEHSLGAIGYLQCRDLLEQDSKAYKALQGCFHSQVFYHTCQTVDFNEISQAFAQHNIPFIPMKGIVIAEYYPVPQVRSMGDMDLAIATENRQRVHEFMLNRDFKWFCDNHAVWTYGRDVAVYEIHDHIMYETLANAVDYTAYFDRLWDYAESVDGTRFEMKLEYHFLYLVAHAAKHIINKGIGFRAFLDFAVLAKNAQLDWNWIEQELKKLQLFEFARTCFALCERWFALTMPYTGKVLDEDFAAQVTEKVFVDGNFGLENEENDVGVAAKTAKRSSEPYISTAIKITIRKLFPPYRDMKLIPWYSFVDGRPWLLPAAWIYRFFFCMKNKFSHSQTLLEQPFVKKKEIDERQKFLDKWGL